MTSKLAKQTAKEIFEGADIVAHDKAEQKVADAAKRVMIAGATAIINEAYEPVVRIVEDYKIAIQMNIDNLNRIKPSDPKTATESMVWEEQIDHFKEKLNEINHALAAVEDN